MFIKSALIVSLLSGLFGNATPPQSVPPLIQKQADSVLQAEAQQHSIEKAAAKKRLLVKASRVDGPMGVYAVHVAHKMKVNPKLVLAVMHVESHGHAHAVSYSGAVGPMQLMPNTATNTLHINPWNPYENIRGGVKLLKNLLQQFNGNVDLALAAYNSGPQNVINHGYSVPNFCEGYVQHVRFVEASI